MNLTRYVYLTIIWHPRYNRLYYVGQHVWDGVGLDPKYVGSCQYRYWQHWLDKYPHATRVLEYTTLESTTPREQYWIKKCLLKHGAFLKDQNTLGKTWLDQFDYGTCLNGRITNMDQLRTSESVAKGNITKWNNMEEQKRLDKMNYMRSHKTHDSYVRAALNTDYKKRAQARASSARKVLLSDGFIGSFSQVVEHLNSRSRASNIMSCAYSKGIYYSERARLVAVPYPTDLTVEDLLRYLDVSIERMKQIRIANMQKARLKR